MLWDISLNIIKPILVVMVKVVEMMMVMVKVVEMVVMMMMVVKMIRART